MRFLILSMTLFFVGCSTTDNYSRFQSASMCMDGPTKLYRDPDIGVCWFVAGKSIVTAPCAALNKMTYCPAKVVEAPAPTPTAEAPKEDPKAAKKKAPATK